MKKSNLTAVDLFCGCGSVTLALRKSKFRVIAAIDNDRVACRSYRRNHPQVKLHEGDIRPLDPVHFASNLGQTKIDLLAVCAPCQPFSSQNKKRKSRDIRSDLILESVRFAKALTPRVIFFENVSGLASPRFRHVLEVLRSDLFALGYELGLPHKVDAATFGVPQRRVRCIMLAWKKPDDFSKAFNFELSNTCRTVRNAIGELPALSSGEINKDDPLHFARRHSSLTLERLQKIPKDGGSRFSLPEHLELTCHKNFKGHPDVYGRMKWDSVAPTLTTGCTDVTRGRFAHPVQDRAISLREAALLQSFPMSFRFAGNSGEIARQIGNAVPFEMARQLFNRLRPMLTAG